MFNVLSSTLES